MIRSIRCIAVAAALLTTPFAIAQTPAEPAPAAALELKAGLMLVSSDGKRIGRIDRVMQGADGTAAAVAVIHDTRFVYVPASTIAATEGHVVTTLTRAEVRKLK